MSCGCNSNPCSCQPRPSVCCTPTVESVTYTFENANAAGIGVFDNETDNLVQFRGIVSANSSLVVTLNATDNTIVLTFDPAALIADIPDATTTQRGILETATNAEALAKAATDKILTPSNLAAIGGTTTFAGLLELATSAETITGTSTTLAVTPAGVAAAAALYSTVTFADAVALNAGVPGFDGQFAAQLDTEQAFVAGSTGAGDWNPILTFGAIQDIGGANTSVFTIGTTILNGSGSGVVNFAAISANFISGSLLHVQTGSVFRMGAGSTFMIGASSVPADSVITTGASNGELDSALTNTFASLANVQTGYTAFANPATLRTCDTATVTLQQLAQIVGTLIADLKVPLIPAT